MTAIADDLVEEIRAQADIVALVGEHTSLRRSGRTYRGACPLHGGEGPNFSVDPQRGIFKCFVCGEGGDVFAFPMKLLGLEFPEAVRYVAERAGITVPERRREPEEDPYRDLRDALAFAADWFQRQLWEEEGGGAARDYLLQERGLPEDALRRFGVGYAPDSWRALREAAGVHEMGDDVLIRAGLVKESERAREPYDLFRGRIMFPIYDLRDRPLGFGGRLLSDADEQPKYINSPDTPIFHKGRIVYGLNWSRHAIRREELALVVEGYMDFISLGARGVENVAAPLGTSLTEDQARLIARYTRQAVLLYDSDKAGLRATFRTADELLRAGVHPSVATLPPGQDPDSLVREQGAGALAEQVDAAIDVIDRKIQILQTRGYLDSIDGKRRAVDALLPTVRATTDEALRDIYLQRIAGVTGVRRGTLERELQRGTAGRRDRGGRRRETPHRAPSVPRLGAERKLLLLLIRDPRLLSRVTGEVEPEDFRTSEYREIYRALVEVASDLDEADELGPDWAHELTPALRERAEELAADPEELTHPEAVLGDAIARLRAQRLERRLAELMTEVLVADTGAAVELASQIREIRRELVELGSRLPGRGLFRGEG